MSASLYYQAKHALLCSAASAVVCVASPVVAQTKSFDVPAQSAITGVPEFARQADIQILVAERAVRNRQTRRVKGRMAVQDGLTRLLSGSGLSVASNDGRTVTLAPNPVVRTGGSADRAHGGAAVAMVSNAAGGAEVADDASGEIIVTAQKRVERAQDVPSSISALGGEQLEQLHATSLQDYAAYVPGFVVDSGGSPGQAQITLRGLNALGLTAMVATYIDDAPLGSSGNWAREAIFSFDMMPYDLERVEVLRGPQGTLYGANSMGGLLKYVTRAPDLDNAEYRAGGEVSAISGAGRAGYLGRAGINLPIVPGRLAVRASVYGQKTPGYIDNAATGRRNQNGSAQWGGRIALGWQASETLSVKLAALRQTIDSEDNAFVRLSPVDLKPSYGDLANANARREPFEKRVEFYSASLDWDLDWANLISASSYSFSKTHQTTDVSDIYGAFFPFITDPPIPAGLSTFELDIALKRFTQEVRLVSPAGRRFEWMIGGYYTTETGRNRQVATALDSRGMPIAGLDPLAFAQLPSRYREIAGFANLTYRISDAFDLTGGIRWARNSQHFRQISTGHPILVPTVEAPGRSSESVVNYAVSPRLHLGADVMLYARIATGYRPGGPNAVFAGVPPQVGSDSITNYEAGIKSQFLGRRGLFNLSVFRIDWKDIKLNVVDARNNGYNINGGTARSQGVEATATYSPFRGLRFSGNAAYTDAHLTEAVPSQKWTDGSALPSAPRWTASFAGQYEFALPGSWRATVGGGYRYVGKRFTTVESDPNAVQLPGYDVVDLNLGLSDGHWDLKLFVRNLFDNRAYLSGGAINSPITGETLYVNAAVLQPRVIGFAIDTKF